MQPQPWELIAYLFSKDASSVLRRWSEMTRRAIRVPTPVWIREGFSGAVLLRAFITDRERGTHLTIVKWIPAIRSTTSRGPSEPQAHLAALSDAPAAFRRHLVDQPFEPIALSDGSILLFLRPAGDASGWLPITDLPVVGQARVIAAVTRAIVTDWNPDLDIRTEVDVRTALLEELSRPARVQRQLESAGDAVHFDWLRTNEDGTILNPVRLCVTGSVFAQATIDLITGRSHGDLHGENVLVQYARGRTSPDSFYLVDLFTYSSSAQLGRDIVRLLLSVTLEIVADYPASQQGPLLSMLVSPDQPHSRQVPAVMSDVVRAAFQTAAKATLRCGADTWRRQYLITVVGQALNFMTYEELGPSRRWWLLRLAGYAATQLLRELGRADEIPLSAPIVRNPFSARRQPIGVG